MSVAGLVQGTNDVDRPLAERRASHGPVEQNVRDPIVVFRRDNRDKNPESFSRQLDDLRQQPVDQAGSEEYDDESDYAYEEDAPRQPPARAYQRQPETRAQDRSGYIEVGDGYPVSQPTSVIAADALWRGDLESNGDIHVHGQVQGSITARTDIFVSEDAEVDATLIANAIVIAGAVRGTVRATSRLEILAQARVSGELISPTLVVHEGSRVNSTIRMTLTAEEQAGTPPRVAPTTRRRSATRF